MIEIPGMTRGALQSFAPHEMEGLRVSLYARALRELVREDIDGELTALADEEKTPSKATFQARRARNREILTQRKIAQAAIRNLLLLDDDEPDDG
jgi:hypothetical protein